MKNALRPTAGATCDILNLVLGPLDLNLLGLEVHLKKVVLDMVARSGAGNLLATCCVRSLDSSMDHSCGSATC